jgi:hypothetical protein
MFTDKSKRWLKPVAVGSLVATMWVVLASAESLWSNGRIAFADPAGIKYTGAGACSNATCHGAKGEPKPTYPGDTGHVENTIWAEKDGHSKAFTGEGGKKGLTNDLSKEIAGKLKLGEATKSDRCLACHGTTGLSVTDKGVVRIPIKKDMEGKAFNVEDGVSCDACHGPADKYNTPHQAKGWTAKQRVDLGSQKLYDEWGLYNTKSLKFRANACTSCHLKIDADMLDAGHPEINFELSSYSTGDWIHWRDNGAWFSPKAWAMGQIVAARESAAQLGERAAKKAKAELIKSAWEQLAANSILARQAAQVLDAAAVADLDKNLTALAANPADEAAKKAFEKTCEALADKLEGMTLDEKTTTALLNGVASEGEQSANAGFVGAQQFAFSITALYGALQNYAKAPADKQPKVDALYEPMGDRKTYKKDDFAKLTKEMGTLFPGGKSLPLPAGPK